MTSTAHALVAGAIASKFTDPLMASTLAFGTHFVMDSIPHWDIGTNWRERPKETTGAFAIAETLFGIAVALYFFLPTVPLPRLALTIGASLLPDWLEAPWYVFFAQHRKHGPSDRAGVLEKLTYTLYKKQNIFHSKAQLPFGLITQVATVALFFFLLK